MGPHEQNLAMQAMRMNQPMPERIVNAPELQLGLQLYLQAFFDMDTDRQGGFGTMPISHSTIADYAAAFEFDAEQTEDLHAHIRAMDNAYIRWLDKKKPKANG